MQFDATVKYFPFNKINASPKRNLHRYETLFKLKSVGTIGCQFKSKSYNMTLVMGEKQAYTNFLIQCNKNGKVKQYASHRLKTICYIKNHNYKKNDNSKI